MFWVLAAAGIACAGTAQARAVARHKNICVAANLQDAVQVGAYTFKSYAGAEGGSQICLQVLSGGKVVFRRRSHDGGHYTLGQPEDREMAIPFIPNGADLTGRGRPNMIAGHWSGGAHCCLTHYVFELKPRLKLLATIHAQDADQSHFTGPESDGRYYYNSNDFVFAYFGGVFAGSPAPDIVLRWMETPAGGGFHLALDKMRQPAPDARQWQQTLDEVADGVQKGHAPQVLWRQVADLIYSGHPDLAWKFVAAAGPAAQDARCGWPDLAAFCARLKASDYWRDIAPALKGAPRACRYARPNRYS